VGPVPEVLESGSKELQSLLAWQGGQLNPALLPGAAPLETQALLRMPEGSSRRLCARLACHAQAAPAADARRVLAVVEDRSAEDERDLAQLEVGALMNAAGIGVATFDSQRGWRRSEPTGALDGAQPAPPTSALQSINRDLVEPTSRTEYEKLQRALRAGDRAAFAAQLPG